MLERERERAREILTIGKIVKGAAKVYSRMKTNEIIDV